MLNLQGSLMAIIAGFLNTPDKANFAATCSAARQACVDNLAVWWGGHAATVTVFDDSVRSFLGWAKRMRASSAVACIRELSIDLAYSSFKDIVTVNELAPLVMSPLKLNITWMSYYRLEAFRRVTCMSIQTTCDLTLFPNMLPPNVTDVEIVASRGWQNELWFPITVRKLTLHKVRMNVDILRGLPNIRALTLKDCIKGGEDDDDVPEMEWRLLPIESLTIIETFDVSDDDDDDEDVRIDDIVPYKCYPLGLRHLTFVVKGKYGTVFMSDFTKAALRSMSHVGVHLYGNWRFDHEWTTSKVDGLTIDDEHHPHILFDFSYKKFAEFDD